MNAIPEIYADRFKLLADAGFDFYRTQKATSNLSRNLEGRTAKLQERELDYVFVKKNKPINTLYAFFATAHKLEVKPRAQRWGLPQVYEQLPFFLNLFNKEKVHITQLMKDSPLLTLDPISSPSDHLPVFVKVDEVAKKSALHRFASLLFNRLKGQ